MSEQSPKPSRMGVAPVKAGRSYPEILQLNQELFHNFQGLIDEDDARKKELQEAERYLQQGRKAA